MGEAIGRDVGVIGLGQMGRGIARRLDNAGKLAVAWDALPEAIAACSLSDHVRRAPPASFGPVTTVVFVVPGAAEVAAGLAELADNAITVIDLTTSNPIETKRLAQSVAAAGGRYIDAGMTGGAAGADAGGLTLMIGGTKEAVADTAPILAHISAKMFHVGPVGSGHTMKLVHNMILHTIFLATCEGARVAERAGLDLHDVIAVLNAGNARSFVSERRFPDHILSATFDARSRVSNLEKDLRMAASFADSVGHPAPYGHLTAELLGEAVRRGMEDQDFSRLYPAFDALVHLTR
jgi:3-hydroxyisobutyrate dehydrogenase